MHIGAAEIRLSDDGEPGRRRRREFRYRCNAGRERSSAISLHTCNVQHTSLPLFRSTPALTDTLRHLFPLQAR